MTGASSRRAHRVQISGGKGRFETVRSGLVEALEEMAVGVECGFDRGVSETLLDDLRMFALGTSVQFVTGRPQMAGRCLHTGCQSLRVVKQNDSRCGSALLVGYPWGRSFELDPILSLGAVAFLGR